MVESFNNRPRIWRWVVGTLLILFFWVAVGGILTATAASLFDLNRSALAGTDEKSRAILSEYPAWQSAIAILISFAPLLLATLLMYRLMIQRPIRTLFTAAPRIKARRVLLGASVMSCLLLLTSLPDLFFNRSDYTYSFKASAFIPYLAVAILLIPMQTSAEEVFYRGWLQQ